MIPFYVCSSTRPYPLMADFHFLFLCWSFALKEVFHVCCFAHFKEDSFICLMCETAERWLSRTDFRWWSTTTLQVEQNRRLSSAWNFPGYWLACSCGVMLHGFVLVLPETIFKAKMRKRKLFCCQIQAGTFFLFQAVTSACYIKTRAHAPNGQQHRTPGMPCLVECFLEWSGGYLLRKYTLFMGKNFHVSLKVWKKHSL